MRHVLVAASLAAVGLMGCAHFECTAHGGREVRALTTEHFIVTSDLPTGEHGAEAERLELLWDSFAAFFDADVDEASIPVVVMADPTDVSAFAGKYSGFVRRTDPQVLVVGSRPRGRSKNTNAHELAHLLSAYLLPRQPRWLAEGLATLLEDASFEDARTVTMGLWNIPYAREAHYVGVASLDALEAWGALTFDGSEQNLYASAWAYLHYLVNNDEARLKRLFSGLKSPRPIEDVLGEVFPQADRPTLQKQVQAYIADAAFRGWRVTLDRTPHVSATRVLAPWEVHLLRARMQLQDPAAAELDVRAAVALAPTPAPPEVDVALARLYKRAPKWLLQAHPDSPHVLVAADEAGIRLEPAAFTRALADDPNNAALLLAASHAFARANDAQQAEALAARGFAVAPWSLRLSLTLLASALARRDCDEAERRLALTLALAPERRADDWEKLSSRARADVAQCRARAAR